MSWVFGPGSAVGGANGAIQFNSSGSFSGSALLTTDGAGSLSASANISASAFYGDGSNLTGVTASAVQVADGPEFSLQFRRDTPVTGEISGSANFVVSSDMSKLFITGSTILSGALSSSDIVPLADEQYGIGTSTTGYESAYIKYLNGAVAFDAVNKEGATISKGQVVYLSGADGGNPAVALAACDVAAKMPAFGIVADGSITNNNTGRIVTFGDLTNITQVNSFSDGDLLYVQTGSNGTSGSLTNVAPTGSGNALQNIGKVIDASAGRIKVISIGRTNATPNLDKGHIFVGNETDQAIQDSTIFVSASAERVGINVTVPEAALHVSASSVHGGESARFEGLVVITSPEGELVVRDTTNNKQVRVTADILPTIEFGDNTDTDDFFLIQGGATSKILVDPSLNAFIISDTTAATEGITYKPAQARVGIHTPTPSHAFTVNGDTYVTGAISASIGISSSQVEAGNIYATDISASANVSASAFYFGPSGRQIISDTGTDMSILASSTGMFISADGGNSITLQNNVAIDSAGVISSSQNISGSGLYAVDAYVSSIPANRVLVSTTNGKVTSHSPFTFSSDALSVPAITASAGIQTEALEVTSSANGSISIGEGIIYTFGGLDRFDAFEGDIKLRDVNYYKAVSTVQTTNFNIEGFQTFLVDTTGSVITGTLPGLTSDGQIGLTYTIKDYAGSGSTNNVVVEPSGSQEVDGGTAAKIETNYGALTVTAFSSSHGYSWGIVSTT